MVIELVDLCLYFRQCVRVCAGQRSPCVLCVVQGSGRRSGCCQRRNQQQEEEEEERQRAAGGTWTFLCSENSTGAAGRNRGNKPRCFSSGQVSGNCLFSCGGIWRMSLWARLLNRKRISFRQKTWKCWWKGETSVEKKRLVSRTKCCF